MKRLIVALFLMLALSLPALAADGAKIGSVEIQKVLLTSEAGKEAKDQLSQLAARYESEKNSKEAELKKLKGELEGQSSVLTEAARAAKDRDYQQRFKEYQRFMKDAQEDLQAKNDEYTGRIIDQIVKVAQEYGRSNGYTVLFVKSGDILYVDPAADVTEQVLKAFNAAKKK